MFCMNLGTVGICEDSCLRNKTFCSTEHRIDLLAGNPVFASTVDFGYTSTCAGMLSCGKCRRSRSQQALRFPAVELFLW